MRDPITKPGFLRLFKLKLLTTTPFGGIVFEGETLYSTALAGAMR